MEQLQADVATPPPEPQAGFEHPLRVVCLAVATGTALEILLHPSLFDGAPPGVGFAISASLLGGSLFLLRGSGRTARGLAGAGIFTAWMVLLRASPVLTAANGLGSGILLGAGFWAAHREKLWRLGLSEYAVAAFETVGGVLGGAGVMVRRDVVPLVARLPQPRRAGAVMRGLLLAAVPVAVFLVLFASADSVFASIVETAFSFEIAPGLMRGLGGAAALSWMALGLYWLAGKRPDAPTDPKRGPQRLGTTELLTVLVALDALFSLFAISQLVQWLNALSRTDYDFSAHARRGFFELVVVTMLVAVIVLTADWLAGTVDNGALRRVHRAARGLVALTGFVLIGAGFRMTLYMREFGLTELRLYTSAFMVWIAAALAWAWMTVLRDRRGRFAVGVFLAAFAMLATLNAVNPDALIARTNLDRSSTEPIDLTYLTTALSADATPVLLAAVDDLADPCDRAGLTEALLASQPLAGDWRSFNLARWRADQALAEASVALGVHRAGCFPQRSTNTHDHL